MTLGHEKFIYESITGVTTELPAGLLIARRSLLGECPVSDIVPLTELRVVRLSPLVNNSNSKVLICGPSVIALLITSRLFFINQWFSSRLLTCKMK